MNLTEQDILTLKVIRDSNLSAYLAAKRISCAAQSAALEAICARDAAEVVLRVTETAFRHIDAAFLAITNAEKQS